MTGIFNTMIETFGFFICIFIIFRILQIFFYPLFCYSSVRISNINSDSDSNSDSNSNSNSNNEIIEVSYNSELIEASDIIILNVQDNLIEDKDIPIAKIV